MIDVLNVKVLTNHQSGYFDLTLLKGDYKNERYQGTTGLERRMPYILKL